MDYVVIGCVKVMSDNVLVRQAQFQFFVYMLGSISKLEDFTIFAVQAHIPRLILTTKLFQF